VIIDTWLLWRLLTTFCEEDRVLMRTLDVWSDQGIRGMGGGLLIVALQNIRERCVRFRCSLSGNFGGYAVVSWELE
jgi:hypothetical protein